MNKYFSITLGIIAFMTLISCGGEKQTEVKTPTVRIDTIRLADADATLQFPGRVVSSEDANISFKVSGTIAKVYVEEGDNVTAGQLVAEIDPCDYKVQLSATEAEYANVKAEADRVIALYNDGATTASNYDKARYGLQQMEAKLKNHRDQLSYCKIYAPFTGKVQTRYFKSGEIVSAGMPVLQILGTKLPEIEINLPASSYLHRDKFVSYSAQFEVLPGVVVPLKYISIAPKANANQLYTMRLQIVGDAKGVAPGMSAWITIYAMDDSGVTDVRIPTTSLVHDGNGTHVFLYDAKSQKVRSVNVDVVRLHTDGTAVVSGSVNPGELVVCTGANHIKDGESVQILEPVSKTNVGGLL